ncbi:MAG: EcsC family protein [Bacteroidota bacterium]
MSIKELRSKMSPQDLIALKKAEKEMENIGLAMRSLNKLGGTIETGLRRIPSKQQLWLQDKVNDTMMMLIKTNLATMQNGRSFKKPSSKTYKALVTSTGALSGILGSTTGLGTAVFTSELIISTKFIMRSIMDIARSEGEDLYDPETQLSCLQVFALGGESEDDDGLETSYYTSRIAMDTALKNATSYLAKNGISGLNKLLAGSTNPLIKLISSIASRFTVQVSEKFVAQAIPLIGAAGGGSVNFMFINHFQKMARAHFTIRRLERKYGKDHVKKRYLEIGRNN